MIVAGSLMVCLAATAQTKPAPKPAAKPAAKPATAAKPAFVLKTKADSVSYAIGLLDGSFYKQNQFEKLNYAAMVEGFKNAMEAKPYLMNPNQCDNLLRNYMQEMATKKVQPTIDEGKKFLAENKKKQGIIETPSGLQYEVLKMGEGPRPADTNTVKVHYTGTLINGTKFDSSVDRGEPAEFPLNGVIRGWTEGVQLMPVGSKFKFYIPYNLAYGLQGSPPVIPGGATLIFDVELLEIVQK